MPRGVHSREHKILQKLLNEARRRNLMEQQDVATRIGRSRNYVTRYESGAKILNLLEFVEICDAIGADPETLFRAFLEQTRDR